MIDVATPRGHVVRWLCRCDCGTERPVSKYSLRDGNSISCGCYRYDRARQATAKHQGRRLHPAEYRIYKNMIGRCENSRNPGYKWYGARGITVDPCWRSDFGAFLLDMGKRPSAGHSIERLDNNAGYGPRNCVWATTAEQAMNRRNVRLLTIDGETMPLYLWAQRNGIPYTTLRGRLDRGIDPLRAATEPLKFPAAAAKERQTKFALKSSRHAVVPSTKP